MMNVKQEMKLDLLVDDELPEGERGAVLRGMTEAEWKTLSLRFLERQVERKGVRQLIDKGSVYPEDRISPVLPFRKKQEARKGFGWTYGIAAGLLIAVGSAALTFFATRHEPGNIQVAGADEVVPVMLPGNVLGDEAAGAVKVPVVAKTGGIFNASFLPVGEPGTKQSVIIIKQDKDRAIAVPVSTTNVKWN